jgi:hypothetical protein
MSETAAFFLNTYTENPKPTQTQWRPQNPWLENEQAAYTKNTERLHDFPITMKIIAADPIDAQYPARIRDRALSESRKILQDMQPRRWFHFRQMGRLPVHPAE